MVNCNPETVSTDYDTADRLYFEPLTLEDVLEVVRAEQAAGPIAGVIVQLGGQTPLRLAQSLKDAGVPIVGTSPRRSTWPRSAAPSAAFWRRPTCRLPSMGWLARLPGEDHRRRDRLPSAGAAVLRARRPRHGDRLRRVDAVGLHRTRYRGIASPPRAGRPLSR